MLHLASNGHGEDEYESFKLKQFETANNAILPFEMPPLGIKPKDFVEAHFGSKSGQNMRFAKGTTTLAFCYEGLTSDDKGGVVVAVDSRASGGSYVMSKTVMKIIPVNERMVATMAGGAADCQFWTRVLAKYCNLFELREKKKITVSAASKYYANVLYGYRGMGLSIGSMVAGVDQTGPSVFCVGEDGSRHRMPRICAVGSGCIAAYGVLDTNFCRKMTDKDAIELGKRAIMHAVFRDTGSGGYCSVAHISAADGVQYFGPFDTSMMLQEDAEKGHDFGPKELIDD